MADQQQAPETGAEPNSGAQLEGGAYEIIRNRLRAQGQELHSRLQQLNQSRKEVFGGIETSLTGTERITTDNNCNPRDMISLGSVLLFGYNVFIGLRSETRLSDVFAAYEYQDQAFKPVPLDLLDDERFRGDFKDLYKFYKHTAFAKFAVIGPHLFMVFRVGKSVRDIKTFKWLIGEDGSPRYIDNRSDHEFRFPPQHEFEWTRTHRDMHRSGKHPHISVEDRLFVETVGGDLSIKIEDNTGEGIGIYSEPVNDPDQTLDDAEIFYAALDNLVLLKIRPYQEEHFRYLVYSEKIQQVRRIDRIEDSCVLLPEGHGIIFANGYYLQTGDYKEFEGQFDDMLFEKRIQAPNGEDHLYIFYNRESGIYALLSYNMIEQRLEAPIVCHGYCLFDSGELIYFKSQDEPRKYHPIQIWQTPFVGHDHETHAARDSYLFKIGNRDIVRCMAACQGVLGLIGRDDSYANLYLDVVRQTTDVLDANYWLKHPETFQLNEPLGAIREAAASALEEFEKVIRIKRDTRKRIDTITKKTSGILSAVATSRFESINEFVKALADLRVVRGEIISLRELRYTDAAAIDAMEQDVETQAERVARHCVEFLLGEQALKPYQQQVETMQAGIVGLQKASEAKKVEADVAACGGELELLIDIVSNLKIEDATQRTTIIDNISTIYATLNQVRAGLKRAIRELSSAEGVAEFASQMKLLNQAVINYLDVCDTPEKCEEYLSKVAIQIEELEGTFADFDEFVVQLVEKREEVYNAFESRKVALVEARSKRADALTRSAERVLNGIRTRVGNLKTIDAINGYFATDLMIDKVRDIVERLMDLGDSVRADDVQSRLKTIREDAVRQLKDRQDLFSADGNLIRLGDHQFSVNTQALDLTVVRRDDQMFLHLTGTRFYEAITDETFLATRDVWDQDLVSENRDVYRGEHLAYILFQALLAPDAAPSETDVAAYSDEDLLAFVRQFMGPRYAEGYAKGVHDHDAARILRALLAMHGKIGLLRYHTRARALAMAFWHQFADEDEKEKNLIEARLRGFGHLSQLFPDQEEQADYIAELQVLLCAFAEGERIFEPRFADEAGEHLFHVLTGDGNHPISPEAAAVHGAFHKHLKKHGAAKRFAASIEKVSQDPDTTFALLCDWVGAFLEERGDENQTEYRDEVAALLFTNSFDTTRVADVSVNQTLEGMVGDHAVLKQGRYALNYQAFMLKLAAYVREVVPRFERYVRLKKELVDRAREDMRLDEFRPQVLTSFVRNRLIDKVYLPLIGANLAKQIGAAGEGKRTDRMGLLLLISPPGYGKTTLMEYLANRLGIIFMKINGPAVGHRVTSIDPAEAPNAAARGEMNKLNLALEMGDNVMIYLDDIQHCNPELLQKFISLCDAQRRIEGVYKGKARTYDLRGRKVAVVMAGNPYTESGEMFRIPDMLANRADTYNLGDIIGDNADAFKLSYLENALTSSPTLNRLATRSQQDVYGIIRIAETGSREGVELEGSYGAEEITEFVDVMKKLLRVRDVVLTVNQEYIRSAGQGDEYRTEPPFKLQGSYRNMNRITESVLPIMNDDELETLILSSYENEAQTLTTGAEANLLKFKELAGRLSPDEHKRWESIKRTFQKKQRMLGVDTSDRVGQVIAQLSSFGDGLDAIRDAVVEGVETLHADGDGHAGPAQLALTDDSLKRLEALAEKIRSSRQESPVVEAKLAKETLSELAALLRDLQSTVAPADQGRIPQVQVVTRLPRGLLQVIQQQFKLIQNWLYPILEKSNLHSKQMDEMRTTLEGVTRSYKNALQMLEKATGAGKKQAMAQPTPKIKGKKG